MNTAIILAAGKGSRMKAQLNKQYLILKEKPILAHTISVFEESSLIDEIILVIGEFEHELCKNKILDKYKFKKVKKIISGGKERQDSVLNGIKAVNEKTDIVLIHDGARPLITRKIIKKCVDSAKKHGAASAGVPIKETIKIMGKDKFVKYTPKREDVWVTQTPQAFRIDVIKRAHEFAIEQEVLGTDDAMLVEHMGEHVKMVEGDYENIKITTPDDLITAEAILGHKRKRR
ncbi:MAG: 2-C-methyl-D-erythritol 4-phosphate cytidylyltransferase [Anaeromicrobium sp.]|jgi:2-C-methyl-D-erythritol 4-phosphate cytidylyltransferase|uniref:2-C-methyl-D-erythritol 4-phosphate cytidylyltransferase n=1 Tax=Anaeromicrobium sp. TaxID=1929132 RepID=UPI0025FA49E7|nr:2-C-methyl-D-erythritol 4-phosphate cytidylyltransferase [Anaeromicrobium sp.]MCT4593908.1 2-C-methyl-D-erythritol 4-phosphate cytidylyltransferase [Anaeromicrobium sp.]